MSDSATLFLGRSGTSRAHRREEQGYILITMLLVVALLAIAAAVALPEISFIIRRDREQEMVHRGVQYSRAIRAYYKKFGRYPTRLEDLENTNNLRFLRKRYKDPITGKDFRLLHYGEPGVTLAGGLAGGLGGGSVPGASPIGASGGLNGSTGFGPSSSSFGSSPSPLGGNNSSFGGNSSSFNGPGAFGSGANSNAGNQNANTAGQNSSTDSSQTTASSQNGSSAGTPDANSPKPASEESSSNNLVASGPIVGVASNSKKSTIREYNKKKKYNEWQFLYDPSMDRGGLITTPYQPSLAGAGMGQGFTPVQGMQPGNTNSPFAQPSGFGNQSAPFGNQNSQFGNSPATNTPAPPAPSSNPPQQQ